VKFEQTIIFCDPQLTTLVVDHFIVKNLLKV